jgi:predicted amidohydrolase
MLVPLLIAFSRTSAHAQELMPPSASAWSGLAPRAETAPARDISQSASGYALNIYGNGVRNVYGGWTTRIQGLQGGNFYRLKARAVPFDIVSLRESVTIILRWRGSFGDEVRPDYVWDFRVQPDRSILFDRVIQTPGGTTAVDIELVLQWSPAGRVSFDSLSLMAAPPLSARPVRLAAVYFRPSGTSSGHESVQQAAAYADQVASMHQPDVMVLGEMLNVIGAPGSLDSKAETVPGPSTDVMASIARAHRVNLAFGILEREGTLLYNTAVLLDRNGIIAGKHRKVQLPLAESSAGIAPGDTVAVFDTDAGRVALLICQDMSFPEAAREAALQGAELLLVPIWGGKTALVRARAVEHGMYVVASGYDYASEIVGPLGNVLAGVSTTTAPGVAIADIDLSRRFREVWLGDWRDISNKERRTAPYNHPASPSVSDPPPPPVDQTPPAVSLTSPASGGTVSGSVSVTATASDNVGVASVRFSVDGTQLGANDTTIPYSISWDSTTAANGTHTLAATAYDAAGNSTSSTITVNVSNATTAPAGAPVPGMIQAEDYDTGGEGVGYHDTTAGNSGGQYRTDAVDIEPAADTGGGFNVGWMAATEWLKYTVSVARAGAYTLSARVAANGPGGTYHVEFGGRDVTGPLTIPNTGGWQSWTSVTATVSLAAGVQSMRFVIDSAGPTGVVGNLNYVKLTSATPSAAVPGTIQAEDYDTGGEGVAYHDTTAGNSGGQYRTDAVDIELTTDVGGGFNVGWMAPTEWLKYTVSVGAAATYTLTARVAANGPGGTFHVEFGGQDVTGPLTIPDTGGWQSWTSVTATVTLTAGVQSMRFVVDRVGPTGVFGNLNYVRLQSVTP